MSEEEHPLFMKSVPSDEQFKLNTSLQALISILEETPQLPYEPIRSKHRYVGRSNSRGLKQPSASQRSTAAEKDENLERTAENRLSSLAANADRSHPYMEVPSVRRYTEKDAARAGQNKDNFSEDCAGQSFSTNSRDTGATSPHKDREKEGSQPTGIGALHLSMAMWNLKN